MTHEDKVAELERENRGLQQSVALALARISELEGENQTLRQFLTLALARIAELEEKAVEGEDKPSSDDKPPSFVKPNRPKVEGPKPPRRKRDKKHNHGRKRETPTQTVEHALERCPKCDTRLHGKSLDYRRQVIELPPPQPVEVFEHRVIKRHCPKCDEWCSPKLDLAGEGQVLGRGRIGTRLISLIATLRHSFRLPFELIQWYLETFHAFKVSIGELVYLLDQVREETKEAVEGLKREMRASAILHADETGWREDGVSGYVWSFSTPGSRPIRYFEHGPGRSQSVPRRILKDEFAGHLVSDFYGGYNDYSGKHQPA